MGDTERLAQKLWEVRASYAKEYRWGSKNETFDMDDAQAEDSAEDLVIGLQWDVHKGENAKKVDLDLCLLLCDGGGNLIDACTCKKRRADGQAVKHTGDNMTGDEEGDDEAIHIDIDVLSPQITN